MSLEDKIGALTEALNRNSDLLDKDIKNRRQIADEATAALAEGRGSKGRGASKSRSAEDEKPAKAEPKADKADKAPTSDETRKIVGDWLEIDDEDERDERKAFVKAALTELGYAKVGEIDDGGHRAKLVGWVQMKARGGKVNFSADDDSGTRRRRRDDDLVD